jgi:NADH-quinone oxidoreductase subunit L
MELLLERVWLIPIFPLLAFAVIILAPGVKEDKARSSWIAIGGGMAAWALSWLMFFTAGEHAVEQANEGFPIHVDLAWLPTGREYFELSFLVDGLTLAMLFMVPFVATMIFIYSTGYHNLGKPNVEPRYSRFFAYVSLFLAGMLLLVISGNMLLFFIAWEIMGLCSYLLIGFWFEKGDEYGRLSPRWSSLKAFMTTRIGDSLLFIGLMLLYAFSGSLNLHEVLTAGNIERLEHFSLDLGLISLPLLPTIALLIFAGAVGKSAQFPLHVWLPDAMAGPTPVSAMIHAATMVAAGVFLVARMLPLFEPLHGSPQMMVVALIGAFTAFMAATIALAQSDVKGVLAYSTISQLGYMIAALGVGGLVAGVFHMLTHAFFKALLFLASGSVIHGMEHGVHHVLEHDHHDAHAAVDMSHAEHAPPSGAAHHAAAGHALDEVHHDPAHVEAVGHALIVDHDGHAADTHAHSDEHAHAAHIDPQNMWNMGGLRKHMPWTWWAFLIGGASLAGVPFITAGFWSKDEILTTAASAADHGLMGGTIPYLVLVLLSITAVLTAFYTGRQLGLTFLGRERTVEATHAHEAPPAMLIPLGVLSLFAVIAGFVNVPAGALPFYSNHALSHMLEEVHRTAGVVYEAHPFNPAMLMVSALGFVAFLAGMGMYAGRAREPLTVLGPVWRFLENKWYIDEVYQALIIRPVVAFATFLARVDSDWIVDPIVNGVGRSMSGLANAGRWFDTNIVDGAVNLFAVVADEMGGGLRLLQTGRIQNYLAVLVAAVLAIAAIFLQ